MKLKPRIVMPYQNRREEDKRAEVLRLLLRVAAIIYFGSTAVPSASQIRI